MQTAQLNPDLLIRLRAKGVSVKAIANRFTVPRAIVEDVLEAHAPDREVLSFADKLSKLLADVPNDHCRRELTRSIEFIRNHHAASKSAKHQKIIEAIRLGAYALIEIAEECRFTREETADLLQELVDAGRIEKRERGGILNRGRKMKYHFYLSINFCN